jgi:L-alanine-DL-glutamate epimerase-like enolase superfamily enzyme
MAQLRRNGGIALACGQNEGLLYRFRDLLAAQAIDYAQPNVCITGGFSQCAKIAGLAASYNVSIANGGAWSYHNMHLQAGVANGSLVEHHYLAVELYKLLYTGLPVPANGWLTLSEKPGLGFEPNRDSIREIAKLPLSAGRAKG